MGPDVASTLIRQISDLRAELHGQLHSEIGSLRSEPAISDGQTPPPSRGST